MRKLASIAISLAALAASPAHAYIFSNSGGFFTSTAGATTFATFDSPTNTAIGTVSGGILNGGSGPGSGNWIAASQSNTITVDLAHLATYFGFYWGTNDGGLNQVDLEVRTMSGANVISVFNGGVSATAYLNITAQNAGEEFDRVQFIMTGGNCCFEVDNLAATLVPEPATLALMGLGLLGLGWRRRD